MWELLWLSGFILLPLFFFLPETSTPTLLYYKARRLRADGYLDATTTDRPTATKHPRRADVVKLALIKPFEISLKDPSIAFLNIYASLHLFAPSSLATGALPIPKLILVWTDLFYLRDLLLILRSISTRVPQDLRYESRRIQRSVCLRSGRVRPRRYVVLLLV
jgi:hypothetical protein